MPIRWLGDNAQGQSTVKDVLRLHRCHDAGPGIIAETLIKSGHKLTGLREEELGLEEVFLRVTKGETQ